MVRLVRRLSDLFYKLTGYALGLLAVELIILVFYGVVKRYIFKAPLTWGYELSILSFMWVSFFGAAHALKSRSHIVFDFLITRLAEKTAKIFSIVVSIFIIGFLSLGIYFGYQVFSGTAAQEFQTISLSLGWLYSALPVGFIIMVIHQLSFLLEEVSDLVKGG